MATLNQWILHVFACVYTPEKCQCVQKQSLSKHFPLTFCLSNNKKTFISRIFVLKWVA